MKEATRLSPCCLKGIVSLKAATETTACEAAPRGAKRVRMWHRHVGHSSLIHKNDRKEIAMKAAVYYRAARRSRRNCLQALGGTVVKWSFECFAARCAAPTNVFLRTDKRTSFRRPSRTRNRGDGVRDRLRCEGPDRHRPKGSGGHRGWLREVYLLPAEAIQYVRFLHGAGIHYAGGFAEYVKIPLPPWARATSSRFRLTWRWSAPRWWNLFPVV